MLIAFEGADGCGKTTLAQVIAKALGCEWLPFPNDEGVTGPLIRGWLSEEWWIEKDLNETVRVGDQDARVNPVEDEMASALVFQVLQSVNRMEYMTQIRQAKDMVLARYWQSGYVYGSLDGLDGEWLQKIHAEMEQPDLNILLDLDAETSLERQRARGLPLERYEGKAAFTQRVVGKYRELWGQHLSDRHTNAVDRAGCSVKVQDPCWPIVDASQSLPMVIADVMALIIKAREGMDG